MLKGLELSHYRTLDHSPYCSTLVVPVRVYKLYIKPQPYDLDTVHVHAATKPDFEVGLRS